MSATGRNVPGNERHALDFYETPPWAVQAILRRHRVDGVVLDAGAGTGAILREVIAQKTGRVVTAFGEEIDEERFRIANAAGLPVAQRDFLLRAKQPTLPFDAVDVVIGNPPYNLALEFIRAALQTAPLVMFLLRLNFLGSQKRNKFFRAAQPDVYVLSKRVSFTGDGSTDNCEYAWFVWRPHEPGFEARGVVEVLDLDGLDLP